MADPERTSQQTSPEASSGCAGRDAAMCDDTTLAIPPRYRWLKRLTIVGLCLAAVLVVLRLWWAYEAGRCVAAGLAEFERNSPPVFVEEFDQLLDDVRPENNAAVLYEQAFAKMVTTTTAGVGVSMYFAEPSRLTEDAAGVAELISANRQAFALMRQARERQRIAWSERLRDYQAGGAGGNSLTRLEVAKLLHLSVVHHHQAGDDEEAVECIEDLIVLGGTAAEGHPVLIEHLVDWGVEQRGYGILEEFLNELDIRSAPTSAGSNSHPATRSQIESLMASMLSETRARQAVGRAILGERALTLDFTRPGLGYLVAGWRSRWSRFTDAVQCPALELDALRASRHLTAVYNAVQAPDWPTASRLLPPKQGTPSLAMETARPFSLAFEFRDGVASNHYIGLAKRRMAAIALAVGLYEIDHGSRPAALDLLVPGYLPSLPDDPFDSPGQQFRYVPNGPRGLLYSVGADGIDRGGAVVMTSAGMRDIHASDIAFYLDPEPEADRSDDP